MFEPREIHGRVYCMLCLLRCRRTLDEGSRPSKGDICEASPAEVSLLEKTLANVKAPRPIPGRQRSKPRRVIADRAYDADWLRRRL